MKTEGQGRVGRFPAAKRVGARVRWALQSRVAALSGFCVWAAGRPVVTNPVGEMKHVIDAHGVGLLAGASAEGMADAILRLREDRVLREELGRRARAFAEEHLRWSLLTDRLEAVYQKACERHEERQRGREQ